MKLAEQLLRLCDEKKMTIALAESCTGGAISAALTQVPGASKVFIGSVVSYHDRVKVDVLGVSRKSLVAHGAVSDEVAREMLSGCVSIMKAEWGIAVTGIAGPDGGTIEKPVGTVFIATGGKHEVNVEKCHFVGTRAEIIAQTVERALSNAMTHLTRITSFATSP